MTDRDCANCKHHTEDGCSSWDCEYETKDLISRADAIEAVKETKPIVRSTERNWGKMITEQHSKELVKALKALPSAEAEVSDYAKWLEKIIVDAETLEWLCEDTPCKEWCDENCHYKSIQAECLRHLYSISKGGDDE